MDESFLFYERITWSMTWMIPLQVSMLFTTISGRTSSSLSTPFWYVAPFLQTVRVTLLLSISIVSVHSRSSNRIASLATTCPCKIKLMSVSAEKGGASSKAWSLGAKTVHIPSPRSSARPLSVSSSQRTVKRGFEQVKSAVVRYGNKCWGKKLDM